MIPSSKIQKDLWEFIENAVLDDPESLLTYCHQRIKVAFSNFESETVLIRKINTVNFPFDFRHGSLMKWMYYGIYQYPISQSIRKILKPSDVFIDAGANIGYFSAIALDIVGKDGEVHSFEPVPEYFRYLMKVKKLNPALHLFINNSALGETPGMVTMVINSENIGGNTVISQLFEEYLIKERINVPVIRLDTYLQEHVKGRIGLIKIDVEGFEYPLLRGLQHYLETAPALPPIICEILPKAYPILETSLAEFAEYMSEYDYQPRLVSNHAKTIELSELDDETDVLFLQKK